MSLNDKYKELYRKHFNNYNNNLHKTRIINPKKAPDKSDKNKIKYKFNCQFCKQNNTAPFQLFEGHIIRCPRCFKLHKINKVSQSVTNPFDYDVYGELISEEKYGELLKSGDYKMNPARFNPFQ